MLNSMGTLNGLFEKAGGRVFDAKERYIISRSLTERDLNYLGAMLANVHTSASGAVLIAELLGHIADEGEGAALALRLLKRL